MSEDDVYCLIEVPKGSRNKYEWDEELGAITLDRYLFSSMVYPVDYGFVPDTDGEDGDPLDAMVLVSEPTFPGCVIPVRVIGLFQMSDEAGVDDKILCVPKKDPNWASVHSLDDVNPSLLREISHFFEVYKQPQGITVEVIGWADRDAAVEKIAEARARRAARA